MPSSMRSFSATARPSISRICRLTEDRRTGMMLFDLTKNELFMMMPLAALIIGVILLIVGVIILITRVLGGDVKKIAEQTARLAQKGIAEEVAGLVGNASTLVDSLNGLIKSAAGVGVFLILIGLLMLAAAYGLALQIQ